MFFYEYTDGSRMFKIEVGLTRFKISIERSGRLRQFGWDISIPSLNTVTQFIIYLAYVLLLANYVLGTVLSEAASPATPPPIPPLVS